MAATAPDVHDALVKAGVDHAAAAALARGLARPAGPSGLTILTAATLAGFTLLGLGLGWVKSDIADVRGDLRTEIADVRSDLRTEIAANRDRIDAVNLRLAGVEERLTRIETLLEERLPARP